MLKYLYLNYFSIFSFKLFVTTLVLVTLIVVLVPSLTLAREFSFGCWNGGDRISGKWEQNTKSILLFGNRFILMSADDKRVHFGLLEAEENLEFLITSDGSYSEREGNSLWKTFENVECILNFYNP